MHVCAGNRDGSSGREDVTAAQKGHFEGGGAGLIADQQVCEAQSDRVSGSGRRDTDGAETDAAEILDGGEQAGRFDDEGTHEAASSENSFEEMA